MSEAKTTNAKNSMPGAIELSIMACIMAVCLVLASQMLTGKTAEVHMEAASAAMAVPPAEQNPIDYTSAIKLSNGHDFQRAFAVPGIEEVSLVCARTAEGASLPFILATENAPLLDKGLDTTPVFKEMEADVTRFCKDLIDTHA